ncbi:MAG: amidase family protein, partial [Geminicoccaceae bacterium]
HTRIYRQFVAFMEDFDVLICPAMSVPPFPHGQLYPTEINGEPLRTYFHWLALAYGLTLTSHPVVCLPCGLDNTGMPFGIQICGKRGGDAEVLAIARALEQTMSEIDGLGRPVPDLNALRREVDDKE